MVISDTMYQLWFLYIYLARSLFVGQPVGDRVCATDIEMEPRRIFAGSILIFLAFDMAIGELNTSNFYRCTRSSTPIVSDFKASRVSIGAKFTSYLCERRCC